MKETFTGKKGSVINITLLHSTTKVIWLLETQPGQPGAGPTSPGNAPECWRGPKSLSKEGSPPHQFACLHLLFLPFACCNGTTPRGRRGVGDTRGRPQRAETETIIPFLG